MVSSQEEQGQMEKRVLQLLVSGDSILTVLRLLTAWMLVGAKGIVARAVSYHLKKKRKSPPKNEKHLAM